jgi:TPR repeat protein
MENNNQKQQPVDSDSNKKESTNSGGNDDTSSTSSKPKDILHDDLCSICMDNVSIMDIETFQMCFECGKVMHMKCARQLLGTKSLNYECPMCRASFVSVGSEESVERLQKWSQRGRSWAQFSLGTIYDQGLGVIKKDPKRACKLYKLAADQGYHMAQCSLGLMYQIGEGVVQSDQLAFKYTKLSADQGYAKAQCNVGVAYEHGIGVEQSDTKACTFFKLSAEQGVAEAQSRLGLCYANGTGVERSFTEARKWWTKSAKQGHEGAIINLKILNEREGIKIKTTSSSSNFTDNSTVCQFEGCESTTKKNGKELMRCPCQTASYCCKEHQKLAYPGHKKECKRLTMENNNQKQHQRDDSNKKESTSSGGNDDGPSTSSKPKDILHDDLCSICMDDVSILDRETFQICYECGKVMHRKCAIQLRGTKSLNYECPMCRASFVSVGSKEQIERLQKWSQRHKSWAQFSLGNLYLKGNGVTEDQKRAAELYKLAADQGHHIAQYNLAGMYQKGKGVTESDTLAFKYAKLCADQGYADAQCKVGFYYDHGKGIERSDTESFKYFELAADQGQCDAQKSLGGMYAQGRGVIQSDELSFKFYKLSAEGGQAQAQFNLGMYYANGTGVEQSYTHAREWWTKAAEQGDENAKKNVKMLDEMEANIKQLDRNELSVDQGNAQAQFNVGVNYFTGTGVEQSFMKARDCWTKAAKQGHKDAINNLQLMDEKEDEVKNLKLLAEQGDAEAQCIVGSCYGDGVGVERSFAEARKWWTKAAKQGQEEAIENLKRLDEIEGIKSTSSSSNFTDNSTVCQFEGCESTTKKNGKELMRCPCQTASYCCKEHQKLAYPGHKKECKRLRKEMSKQKPNDRCDCGSTKKYKKCCGFKKR